LRSTDLVQAEQLLCTMKKLDAGSRPMTRGHKALKILLSVFRNV